MILRPIFHKSKAPRKLIYSCFLITFATFLLACDTKQSFLDPQGQSIDEEITVVKQKCSSFKPSFVAQVWPLFQSNCISCHVRDGASGEFFLVDDAVPGYHDTNFKMTQNIAIKSDSDSRSYLYAKPANLNKDHGGGTRFNEGSVEYTVLYDMSNKLLTCDDDTTLPSQALVYASPSQRLQKTTLALSGRLPTAAEEQLLAQTNNENDLKTTLDQIMDNVMNEDSFYDHFKEIYNDLLLIDAFPGASGLNFDLNNFENRNYFDTLNLTDNGYVNVQGGPNQPNELRIKAGYGLAQAPLKLIEHVMRLDRPFTEILTADYVMVNPYSATILGATVRGVTDQSAYQFDYGDPFDALDPNDFREADIDTYLNMGSNPYPHAGILTTLTFFSRYPTTNTNLNRARARYVFKYFLDVDIEGLANRASLNLNAVIGDFPTYEDPQCKQCHDVMDPVASLFKSWRNQGRYQLYPISGNNAWPSDRVPKQMLDPGFTIAEPFAPINNESNIQWMAQKIIQDSRFALVTVKTIFKGYTGQDTNQDMNGFLEQLKTIFIDSNYNMKALIKAIMHSAYFNAQNLEVEIDPNSYAGYGMGRLLTPEQLDRKIRAVTGGYEWTAQGGGRGGRLTDQNTYRLFYGGIDSANITTRTTDPTSIMAGTQERIAFVTACDAVPADFDLPVANRVLFPESDISLSDLPDGGNGTARIKNHILALHKRFLGEDLKIGDPEIEATYNLFVQTQSVSNQTEFLTYECRVNLSGDNTNPVKVDTNGTVRAWMAVVAYLLLDYKFLYE